MSIQTVIFLEAGMPVMEGEALLFKYLAGIDAIPLCLGTKDPDELILAVQILEPSFGRVNPAAVVALDRNGTLHRGRSMGNLSSDYRMVQASMCLDTPLLTFRRNLQSPLYLS